MSSRYVFGNRQQPNNDPMLDQHPHNEMIRAGRVRLIGSDGTNQGVIDTRTALAQARQQGLDLVVINQAADPPVARITDHGKFVYEAKRAKKEQERRNRENQITVKEIQLRPVTGQHDLEVKIRHAREWLDDSNKIKVVMRFKGREQSHTDLGFAVMRGFIGSLGECRVEQHPEMQGRNMVAVISPAKA